MPASFKKWDGAKRTLCLVLVEKFPKDRGLDKQAKKVLKRWMAEFADLAKAKYKSVGIFHDASNGCKERLYSNMRGKVPFRLLSIENSTRQ